jgi:nucleoside-triphosphatase
MINAKNLFVTGKPACGKTTLIREVCFKNIDKIGGFYTQEIYEANERQGFLLKTFDGNEGVLAKKGMKSSHKLNKYGIDLSVLENIGIKAVYNAMEDKKIIVIDEIGSMEIISEVFRKALMDSLGSSLKVLASIRYQSQPFTNEIKQMSDSSIVYLSRDNYPEVKNTVEEWLNRGKI